MWERAMTGMGTHQPAAMLNRCHFGDCRDSMRTMIESGLRVQMCVTSPPYWGLRDYGVDGQLGLEPTLGEYIDHMVEVFRLVRELLTDDGTLWLNMGDGYAGRAGGDPYSGFNSRWSGSRGPKQDATNGQFPKHAKLDCTLKPKDLIGQPWRLAFALQDDGWYLRQDIIWHKPNPMPESVRDRCTKAHEYIFLLSKSEHYYFDQDAIKEQASENTHPRRAGNGYKTPDGWDTSKGKGGHGEFHREGREKGKTGYQHKRKVEEPGKGTKNNTSMDEALAVMPSTRNKRSVWAVPSEPFSGAHFATFPTKLIEPCILAGSRPGDIVLDPFFGSGTTGQVAESFGRQWVGCELNDEYGELQRGRIRQRGLAL